MPDYIEIKYLDNARRGDRNSFDKLVEPYLYELRVHCYRMLGSIHDAEDLLQETLLLAWRHLNTFEGRASFRAWLYKIATNACLDTLDKYSRRILPNMVYSSANPKNPLPSDITDPVWIEPFPDSLLYGEEPAPEAYYSKRESIRLAFLIALQALPPRQRAVLILCDVLDWGAKEISGFLDMTVSAVNSCLHRARTTLAKHYHHSESDKVETKHIDETTQKLLEKYVQAWETADIEGLIILLKNDATFVMPPSPAWYKGRSAIRSFINTMIFVNVNQNEWQLRPTQANTKPAFGLYKYHKDSGLYKAYAIQVLIIDKKHISEVISFMEPKLFHYFELPEEF
jgi:RNA polymerase sigma-70 factor (ECF subfamily)